MKMKRRIVVSAAIIAVLLGLSGCSGMTARDRNTAIGAGAVGGAVLQAGALSERLGVQRGGWRDR